MLNERELNELNLLEKYGQLNACNEHNFNQIIPTKFQFAFVANVLEVAQSNRLDQHQAKTYNMGKTVQQHSQVIKLKEIATFIQHFEYLVVCVHNVQEGCQVHQNDAKKCEESK